MWIELGERSMLLRREWVRFPEQFDHRISRDSSDWRVKGLAEHRGRRRIGRLDKLVGVHHHLHYESAMESWSSSASYFLYIIKIVI